MTAPHDHPESPPTNGRADALTVRPALPRGVVVLLGMAAAVITAAGLRSIAWLIGPAFLALIIVIAVAPVQRWFQRKGWPRWAITIVLVLAVYGVVVALALTIIVSIARLATTLPEYAGQSQALAQSGAGLLARFGVGPGELQHIVQSLDIGKLAGLLGTFLSSVAGLAGNLVFILALLLFLSIETGDAGARIRLIAKDRPAVGGALTGFAHGTRQYLVVTTVFGLIVAVLDTVALALIGIPLAVTWGLLSFVTNYIPNIGFLLGVIPPALLGLLVGGPKMMVLVIVVYCVLNFVVQSLIQPRFIGDAVGLSVTVTFLALAFWAWLIGPLGAILAIPLTLLAKALLVDIDPGARWADALLRADASDTDGSPTAPATALPLDSQLPRPERAPG
ncbi:AI-2E family transporter [Pseudonocardia sp. DLS-67]